MSEHAPAVVKLPHELQSLAEKWRIRRQPRAWLFTNVLVKEAQPREQRK